MTAAEMRVEAGRKRHSAEIARRTAPVLSVAADQEAMLSKAATFDGEATQLEAAADTLDAMNRQT